MAVEVYVHDAGEAEGRALSMPPGQPGHDYDNVFLAVARHGEEPDIQGQYRDDQLLSKCRIPRDRQRVSYHSCDLHSLVIVKWDGDIREG